MNVEIISAQIIRGQSGPDYLFLQTTLPEPTFPYNGNAVLKLTVSRGSGEAYIKKNFNVPFIVTP